MFYLYFGFAVIFLVIPCLLFRAVQITLKTEVALTQLNEALKKRNIAAIDMVRLVESRINPKGLPLEEVRKYAKLTAIADKMSDKALNAGLLRDFLASILNSLKKNQELSEDRNFVSACFELRDSEYAVDAAAIKYNGSLFFANRTKANPLIKPFIGIVKFTHREYFSLLKQGRHIQNDSKPDRRVSSLADEFIRALNRDFSLNCSCGLEIHVPPDFSESVVICQLCGSTHNVPDKYERGAESIIKNLPLRPAIPNEASRNEAGKNENMGKGWGILRCTCGKTTQLSPGFAASYVRCPACGNRIVPKKIAPKTASV
jgi:DNA-directed RNA polymerase subunit RPC12/RpoP